jgi:hypothetical protein
MYVVKLAPETGIENSSESLPRGLTLLNNYPNPFNGSTTIRFGSPMEGRATLQIYDILGRIVKSYETNNGAKEITWDGADSNGEPVTSGLYFYGIKEWPSTVRKMVLLR